MTTFTNTPLSIDELPQVNAVQFQNLHPKYRWINLSSPLTGLLFTSISAVIVTINVEAVSPTLLVSIGIVLTVLLLFILSFFGAKARRYALREHDMLFQQGLFWQKTTAVAFNRIQHIDLTHGPLERRYQISSLKFFTAGGSSVDLKIPGLPQAEAQKIRAFILGKTTQDTPDPVTKNEEENHND
jgi:membrane protein YdbS with pleckstrin-like domain